MHMDLSHLAVPNIRSDPPLPAASLLSPTAPSPFSFEGRVHIFAQLIGEEVWVHLVPFYFSHMPRRRCNHSQPQEKLAGKAERGSS